MLIAVHGAARPPAAASASSFHEKEFREKESATAASRRRQRVGRIAGRSAARISTKKNSLGRRAPHARGFGASVVNLHPSTQLLNRGAVARHPVARIAPPAPSISAAPLARARIRREQVNAGFAPNRNLPTTIREIESATAVCRRPSGSVGSRVAPLTDTAATLRSRARWRPTRQHRRRRPRRGPYIARRPANRDRANLKSQSEHTPEPASPMLGPDGFG